MSRGITTVVVACAVLLGGCGGASSDGEPEPSPTPTIGSAKQLERALPSEEDLPKGMSIETRCPGDKEICGDPKEGRFSLSFGVSPPGDLSDAGAEERHQSQYPEGAYLGAELHDDEKAAAAALNEAKPDELVGRFDTKAKETDRGFIPGERGSGTIENVDLDGWKGTEHQREGVYLDLKGTESGPRQAARLHVRQGRATVYVDVRYSADGRKPGEAVTLARRLLGDYLDRLR